MIQKPQGNTVWQDRFLWLCSFNLLCDTTKHTRIVIPDIGAQKQLNSFNILYSLKIRSARFSSYSYICDIQQIIAG
ncbi:MAG TPA: hypothetical protein VKY57_15540 [Chitinispirillaceae bacterium]|nr:hypothetical protein [Chitinispirillaceae bacterium]